MLAESLVWEANVALVPGTAPIQADLGDTAGWVHSKKASRVNFLGFPIRVKVMFTLYCSLLSVQLRYV